ncbi:carbohydrate ABC transporter permease [Streptomyces triticirhizae]|uniref:Carbohydrate ABC transporter permease n=1 Tax=Streptomyces triticirhizae TaxID=2483353 RepID=A0A3M2LM06_9ACTN|nr:carbohydrate ABC transporter permease [Streptomyces triticirhizae]RMI37115.1 carbohydrate ABC transporter permease [Streptomyces triticirhizae]
MSTTKQATRAPRGGARRSGRSGRVLWGVSHGLVWLYALALVLPLYYLVISSFKKTTDIFDSPLTPPVDPVWHYFEDAIRYARLDLALVNSALVTAAALALTLLLALPASFALARSRGRLSALLERIFAMGFLVPTFAALVPTFLMAAYTGLFHTRTFVILLLPAGALPLSVVLLTQFMRTVPPELEESARVDGATTWTVLWRVFVPLSMPGIATVLLLNFLNFWNEYLYSLVIIGPDTSQRTIQVALPTLQANQATEYGVLMAGTAVTLIPVYIVYIVLQRRMEQALISGAVKM